MAKKKVPAKIPVASSFFSMHKHARWLLVLFILASMIFVTVAHKTDVQQDTELTHLLRQATNETISWKTYTNPVGKFSIQYPVNWKLVESHERSNKVVDDPKEINTATLSGQNGEIVLEWGPMGFGGGCDETDHTTLQLKQVNLPICKAINNGKIVFSQIYPPDQTPAFSAYASTTEPETEDVIKNVFATLSFTK
jgi:hypothetical protein